MIYQWSSTTPGSLIRQNLAAMFVAFLSVTISLSTAQAQITEGTSQPPQSPKPRFPQLPDDQPDPKEVTPTTPKTKAAPDRNESVGRIRAIEKRTLKYEENDNKEMRSVLVSADAKITLNREPAELTDLQVTDFVRVTTPPGRPEFAVEVAAARVVNTPPSDPPPPARVPNRAPRTRPEPLPDRQGGLGLIVSDNPGTGVLILEVNRGTPAFEAEIQTGDYLIQIDETEIVTPDDFLTHVRSHAPSEKVAVTVWRDGKTRKGTVALTTRDAARDREAEDSKALIISETHGDDAVVIKRKPRTVVLDREPEEATVIVEQEKSPLPREYDELAEKYLDLQDRLRQLELELERLKK